MTPAPDLTPDPDELAPVGRILEPARAALGLSVRAAATVANLSEARWRQIVRGQSGRPGLRTLVRMARAVGATSRDVIAAAGLPVPGDDELDTIERPTREQFVLAVAQRHALTTLTPAELAAEWHRALRRVANACWGLNDTRNNIRYPTADARQAAIVAATAECDQAEEHGKALRAEYARRGVLPPEPLTGEQARTRAHRHGFGPDCYGLDCAEGAPLVSEPARREPYTGDLPLTGNPYPQV